MDNDDDCDDRLRPESIPMAQRSAVIRSTMTAMGLSMPTTLKWTKMAMVQRFAMPHRIATTRMPTLQVAEICDPLSVDEDCDGLVNEADAEGGVIYFADADGDGYGNPAISAEYCPFLWAMQPMIRIAMTRAQR